MESKYYLNFVGVYAEATPRELMIQNIQKMLYIKMENEDATIDSIKSALYAQRDDVDERAAIDDWVSYQFEVNPTLTDGSVVVPADGTHFIQFDLRPVRNN